jgi:hypothetical protein
MVVHYPKLYMLPPFHTSTEHSHIAFTEKSRHNDLVSELIFAIDELGDVDAAMHQVMGRDH